MSGRNSPRQEGFQHGDIQRGPAHGTERIENLHGEGYYTRPQWRSRQVPSGANVMPGGKPPLPKTKV